MGHPENLSENGNSCSNAPNNTLCNSKAVTLRQTGKNQQHTGNNPRSLSQRSSEHDKQKPITVVDAMLGIKQNEL